jgi:hypothetical protein
MKATISEFSYGFAVFAVESATCENNARNNAANLHSSIIPFSLCGNLCNWHIDVDFAKRCNRHPFRYANNLDSIYSAFIVNIYKDTLIYFSDGKN